MKVLFKKYLHIITLFGAVALTLPFVKIISQASVDEMIEDGYSHISYDKLSAFSVVWEGIEYYLSKSVDNNEALLLCIFIVLIIIALTQIIAGLLKRNKVVLYSAVVLFSSFFALLVFTVQKSHEVTICYGYYTYLLIQATLILFMPSRLKEADMVTN